MRRLRNRYGHMHSHDVVARRHTHDGALVQFWSDGGITVGHELNNRLVARGVSKKILWLIAGDVSVYDAGELVGLVRAARKALDMHEREPWRVREQDLRGVMRAYAPK